MPIKLLFLSSVLVILELVQGPEAFAETSRKRQAPNGGQRCEKALTFKQLYVDLLNDLKYKGKDVFLGADGKIKSKANDSQTDDEYLGKTIEKDLFNHYTNALKKVTKIYQFLNKTPDNLSEANKLIKANPKVAEFFRAIDPIDGEEKVLFDKLKIQEFTNQLKKVQLPEELSKFKLDDNDEYFLSKLLTHSQDQICTQKDLKSRGVQEQDYIPVSLDLMITSIRKLKNDDSIQNPDPTILLSEGMKSSLQKFNEMRDILTKDKNCKAFFSNPQNKANKIFGDAIQECNYRHFIDSLLVPENKYNGLVSVLHFINANKNNRNASTGFDWIRANFDKALTFPSCKKSEADGSYSVSNMPMKDGNNVNEDAFTCSIGNEQKTGKACKSSLELLFSEGKGWSIKKKPESKMSSLSIAGSVDCQNLTFAQKPKEEKPPQEPANPVQNDNTAQRTINPCSKEKCEAAAATDAFKGFKLTWDDKENKCFETKEGTQDKKELCSGAKANDSAQVQQPVTTQTDNKEKECKDKNTEYINSATPEEGIRTERYVWDGKQCIDKKDRPVTSADEEANPQPERKPGTNYPQSRFVPINIPIRQMIVLPGMP